MKELISNVSSIYWWISVVIVGILINIISYYLTRKLDTRLSNVSSWWRKKSEIRKSQRLKKLDKLRNDPHEQLLLAFETIQSISLAIALLIFGVLFVSMGIAFQFRGKFWEPIICFSISAIALITALMIFFSYMGNDNLLQDSRNKDHHSDD